MKQKKGYTEMKDSGIDWIGGIPKNWKCSHIKRAFDVTLGKMLQQDKAGEGDTLESYLCAANIKWSGVDTSVQKQMWFSSVEKEQYLLKSGDLLIMEGGLAGTACSYNGEYDPCYIQNSVLRCRGKSGNLERFLYYWINAVYCKGYIDSICNKATIQHYTKEKVMDSPIFLPPLEEQQSIVFYLDTQCAKIDEIIAQAKASIEDYKQWKASIIYEAVTKGLDPNVEMKESGVEWIPLLPTTVKLSRVGMHFSITLGKMLCPKPLDDNYTLEPYFCAANVHFSGVDSENLKEMWFNSDEKERYKVAPGDLLVVEGGAGAGGCAVIETVDFPVYVQNSIMIVRPKSKNNVKYLKYFIEALVGRGYVDFACNKATIPHFTKEKLSAVPFPIFDGETQGRIVDFLDSKCGRIDDLIFQKQSLIDDLESYKKSVIYEVVTGKRRVQQ